MRPALSTAVEWAARVWQATHYLGCSAIEYPVPDATSSGEMAEVVRALSDLGLSARVVDREEPTVWIGDT